MRDDELAGFIERDRAQYADDLELNGHLSPEDARAKAGRDFASLYPDGRPREGLVVDAVEDEATGAAVGWVVYAERPAGSGKAFLYSVSIDEERRGQGLGRAAMQLFEQEARERGFARVSLNVFGGNERARSLYRSLGYREDSVDMGKDLAAPDTSGV
jgi:ribosomal protein S18 acetylase RimI-like enzyme